MIFEGFSKYFWLKKGSANANLLLSERRRLDNEYKDSGKKKERIDTRAKKEMVLLSNSVARNYLPDFVLLHTNGMIICRI